MMNNEVEMINTIRYFRYVTYLQNYSCDVNITT